MPKFQLQEIEDYYVYFVDLMGFSEELFWYSEWSVLFTILENKKAVEEWRAYIREKEQR